MRDPFSYLTKTHNIVYAYLLLSSREVLSLPYIVLLHRTHSALRVAVKREFSSPSQCISLAPVSDQNFDSVDFIKLFWEYHQPWREKT
mmetsp:Transcript_16864/g.35115  ORF Transcript_16864/g.35115 Transcript_16864/m.35115 type:complete len:88 (-) Transcript_16864:148-411(-)